MRSVLLTFAFVAIALGFVAPSLRPSIALANQAPQQSYCVPPNVFSPGDPANARPFMRNWTHSEICGGQPGDFWTDGALFNPTFVFSGSNYNFTLPANVWFVKGQRVYTAAAATSAPASATSYWYLDSGTQCATNCSTTATPSASPGTSQWVSNTSGIAPNATSVLEYTVVANGSGVTSVTNPAYASFFTNGSVAAADFTATNQAGNPGDCAIYDNTGKITAQPCPGGTPTVMATATACGAPVAGGTLTVYVPVCPSPYPTPTQASPCPGYPAGCVALYSASPSPNPLSTIPAQTGSMAVSDVIQGQSFVFYPNNGLTPGGFNAIIGCSIENNDLCFYNNGGLAEAFLYAGNPLSNQRGIAIGGGTSNTGFLALSEGGGIIGNPSANYTTLAANYDLSVGYTPCNDNIASPAPVPTPMVLEICRSVGAVTGGTPVFWLNSTGQVLFRGSIGADNSTPAPYGISGGIESPNASPTPFILTDNNAGATSTSSGFRLKSTHACANSTDHFIRVDPNSTNVATIDCSGGAFFTNLNVSSLTGVAGTETCTDGSGNLTTTGCSSGGQPTLVCTGLATCAPNGGPTPGILVPTPQATGCLVISPVVGPPANILLNATGCGGSPAATSTPFETVVTNTTGVTNAWSLKDTGAFAGGCPGTFAAYVGATAIPTPSPAPSGLICGSKTIASDGNASVYFPGTSTDYLTFPVVMPSSSPSPGAAWTVEIAIQSGGDQAGTSTRSSFLTLGGSAGILYCTDEAYNGLGIFGNSTTHTMQFSGGSCTANRPSLIDWVYSAGLCTIYVNGLAVATPAGNSGICTGLSNQTVTGIIGRDSGTSQDFLGLISDLSIYTSALSATTAQQHYFAFRCGGTIAGTCVP